MKPAVPVVPEKTREWPVFPLSARRNPEYTSLKIHLDLDLNAVAGVPAVHIA